jgi:hypothetical protein
VERLPTADTNGAVQLGKRLILGSPTGPRNFSFTGRAFHLEQRIPFEGAGRIATADLNRDGISDLARKMGLYPGVESPARGVGWERDIA